MSRKDFELIAETILNLKVGHSDMRLTIAQQFADALATTNSAFNRERFIRAATVGKKAVAK